MNGGAGGNYDYRIYTTLSYMRDSWSVGLRNTFLPSIQDASYATNKATPIIGPSAYTLFSAFGSYTVNKQLTVRGGIDNLFNTDPEVVGRNPGVTNANGSTSPGFYDVLGRRYYIAVQMSF